MFAHAARREGPQGAARADAHRLGTDDIYFPVEWADWLAATIPGTRRTVRIIGARIFFPEERWREFNLDLRAHWETHAG